MLRTGPAPSSCCDPSDRTPCRMRGCSQVLDLCMRVGEVLLSSGEAAADTSATMTRLAGACGLDTVDVDITFTSITMCCHRGKATTPVTAMRSCAIAPRT